MNLQITLGLLWSPLQEYTQTLRNMSVIPGRKSQYARSAKPEHQITEPTPVLSKRHHHNEKVIYYQLSSLNLQLENPRSQKRH